MFNTELLRNYCIFMGVYKMPGYEDPTTGFNKNKTDFFRVIQNMKSIFNSKIENMALLRVDVGVMVVEDDTDPRIIRGPAEAVINGFRDLDSAVKDLPDDRRLTLEEAKAVSAYLDYMWASIPEIARNLSAKGESGDLIKRNELLAIYDDIDEYHERIFGRLAYNEGKKLKNEREQALDCLQGLMAAIEEAVLEEAWQKVSRLTKDLKGVAEYEYEYLIRYRPRTDSKGSPLPRIYADYKDGDISSAGNDLS